MDASSGAAGTPLVPQGVIGERSGEADPKPGNRNVAGETLWDALIPLQPEPINNAAADRTNANLPFIFTCSRL